jgi:hypothetical protein
VCVLWKEEKIMEELKERINAAITTMRKYPNVVTVDGRLYGPYFYKKEIYVICDGSTDVEIDELPKDIVEKIVVELEAGRFEASKCF